MTQGKPAARSTLSRQKLSDSSAAAAIVRTLKAAGVEAIFGQSCPIALFLCAEKEGIRQIGYRTENAGAAMADGFARASGRVGVMAAQNGPAAALIVAGLCEALRASVPIVAIVQDVARSNTDRNAFQELDHEQMFKSCAKWVRRLTVADRAAEYTERAIRAATTGRPGPAVLIVPFDVIMEDVADPSPSDYLGPEFGRYPVDRFVPARPLLARAVDAIASAKRPLIVAGGGVHLSGAAQSLARLQHLWQVPVATTNMGKGAVDEAHPLSVGVVGYVMGTRSPTRFLREYVETADVVLFVGNRTNENGTASWTLFNREARFIHVDVDPDEIGRNYPCLRLLGDAASTLDALVEEAASRSPARFPHAEAGAVRGVIADARQRHAQEIAPFSGSDASPLRPERLMRDLDAALEDAIWCADASYSSLWVSQFARSRRAGQRFLTPRGIGGLGWGLPLAIGAKLAQPERPVIALVGDGGFAHCWSELETARRHGLPVIVVVLNNGVLGFQRDAETSRFGSHTEVCTLGPLDHAAIAQACGCAGRAVRTPEELQLALAEALASRVPYVIDAHVAPEAFPPITAFEALGSGEVADAAALFAH
ncbi:MAG: acetolactate synthase catalytic subunit [Ramlibacter sp.]